MLHSNEENRRHRPKELTEEACKYKRHKIILKKKRKSPEQIPMTSLEDERLQKGTIHTNKKRGLLSFL